MPTESPRAQFADLVRQVAATIIDMAREWEESHAVEEPADEGEATEVEEGDDETESEGVEEGESEGEPEE